MAMFKVATAQVVQPSVSAGGWRKVRTAATHKESKGSMPQNLIAQASEIFGKPFNPDDYLLTHATIVASVNVDKVPGVKLGSVVEDGFKVNRRYADYRVTSDTDKYINNNLDCWSRDVLLMSYQTFIGAHNFQEHVQIEDLSKGRVIDAVARDIGDSVYVDILVATDRKNTELVKAIESGQMGTMSMGCQVDGTICTKCGNWAVDETEMCPHIRYEKGNVFYDENGGKHRIAELCGHEDIEPTGGVTFIEASWVDMPAFTGAVMRNILSPEEGKVACTENACTPLSDTPAEWDADKLAKVAALELDDPTIAESVGGQSVLLARMIEAQKDGTIKTAFTKTGDAVVILPHRPRPDYDKMAQWGDDEEEEGGDEPAGTPLEELETEIEQAVLDRVKKRLREQITQEDMEQEIRNPDPSTEESTAAPNDTIIKEGLAKRASMYRTALQALTVTATSNADLMNKVAKLNGKLGINIPVSMYRAALKVGATNQHRTLRAYLMMCEQALGRKPSAAESKTLVRLGTLLSRRGSRNPSGHDGETR